MIFLVWKALSAPLRLVIGSLRFTLTVIRVIGPSRVFFLVAGAGVALLFAPKSGQEMRKKFHELWRQTKQDLATTSVLARRVQAELAANAATRHLTTPEVAAEGVRVVLRGPVPSLADRDACAKVAAAVPGVAAVDNHLRVGD